MPKVIEKAEIPYMVRDLLKELDDKQILSIFIEWAASKKYAVTINIPESKNELKREVIVR